MYVVVGYHGLDDQCITVRVVYVACISVTEGDVIYLPSKLLYRPLVQGVSICERSFPVFSDITVLGSSLLPGEMWSTKDYPDLVRRLCLLLVIMRLSSSVTDIVLVVPITDEFLDLILKYDVLPSGVADVLVIPAIVNFF